RRSLSQYAAAAFTLADQDRARLNAGQAIPCHESSGSFCNKVVFEADGHKGRSDHARQRAYRPSLEWVSRPIDAEVRRAGGTDWHYPTGRSARPRGLETVILAKLCPGRENEDFIP